MRLKRKQPDLWKRFTIRFRFSPAQHRPSPDRSHDSFLIRTLIGCLSVSLGRRMPVT
jgi:hypothetical protein